jgi:hypothetical protein
MSRRVRIAAGSFATILVAITPALGSAAATKPVKGASGPLTATLTPPPTHSPKDNVKEPITVTATLNGKPASHATAFYEFLFAGAVVSTQYVDGNKHFSFNGHYSDTLGPFGASAVGQPLTLRVVVKDAGHTVNLNWAITVVK